MMQAMSLPADASTPGTPAPAAPSFDPEVIFSILNDPTRRHILAQLASGATLGATELAVGTGRSANLVNKHLMLMRDAGLVTAVESPVKGDRRRSLFSLVPALRPVDATVRELDFGCCVLRLPRR
jgi:DNA-binding transcriptional ArsR family regulator